MGECFPDPNKKFLCSFFNCKATFSKSWKLEAHLCKHTGLRPFACEGCDKSYGTRYQLTRHQLSHSGEKLYLCSVEGCSGSFTTNTRLKKHTARVHLNEGERYVCDHEGCGQVFRKNKQLKTHKTTHTNLLPFLCNFEGCERKFPAWQPLKRHEKVHEGYPCVEEGCPFRGKTWTDYQNHKKMEHRTNLQCDSCKKVFHIAWFLKKHQQFVHSGEKRVFKCTLVGCQKTFSTRFNLQSHVVGVHEGKRPFTCSKQGCSKAFAMEESLKRHAVVHDPQRKKMTKKTHPKQNKSLPSKPCVSDAAKLADRLETITLNKSATSQKKTQP